MKIVLRLAAVVVLAAGLLTGATSAGGSQDTGPAATPAKCTVSTIMVPTCGVWWGEALHPAGSSSLVQTVATEQTKLSRRLDIVHTFHGWHDDFPTDGEKTLSAHGHMLLIDWGPRNGHGATPHWSTIASGAEDAVIRAEATRLKALKKPVMLAFSHEPESGHDTVDAHGSPAQFVAAYRHVHHVFEKMGAYNVIWVWDTMGIPVSQWYAKYPAYYPGDYFVDWIAWDPYNPGACAGKPWQSLVSKAKPFYDWLVRAGHGNKPFMLAEYGSAEQAGNVNAKADWFGDVKTALAQMPKLKAMVYFNINGEPIRCAWQANSSTRAWSAFSSMSHLAPFNPTAKLTP